MSRNILLLSAAAAAFALSPALAQQSKPGGTDQEMVQPQGAGGAQGAGMQSESNGTDQDLIKKRAPRAKAATDERQEGKGAVADAPEGQAGQDTTRKRVHQGKAATDKATAQGEQDRGTTANAPEAGQNGQDDRRKHAAPRMGNADESKSPDRSKEPTRERAAGRETGRDATAARETPKGGRINVQGRFDLDEEHAGRFHDRLAHLGGGVRVNADFDVRVGVAIPAHVELRPVPADIISEYPQFRGFDFVVIRDEVVIVEPRSRQIVEVVGGTDRAEATGTISHRRHVRLTDEQREMLRHRVDRSAEVDFDASTEDRIPDSITLVPIPREVITEAPDVGSYRYVVTRDNRIILVDPATREVIEDLE